MFPHLAEVVPWIGGRVLLFADPRADFLHCSAMHCPSCILVALAWGSVVWRSEQDSLGFLWKFLDSIAADLQRVCSFIVDSYTGSLCVGTVNLQSQSRCFLLMVEKD